MFGFSFGSVELVNKVYAQCDPGAGGVDLGECLKLSNDQPVRDVYTDPAFLVNLIVRNLFVFGGIVLFFMFIYAGLKFMQGTSKGLEEATKVITWAAAGFVVMFSAFWIVQLIAYITGANIVILQ